MIVTVTIWGRRGVKGEGGGDDARGLKEGLIYSSDSLSDSNFGESDN